MTRFSDQSRKERIPGITKVRFREGGIFLPPTTVCLAPRKAAAPQPLAREPSFIAAFDVPTPLAPAGITARTGLHRCAKADLIVVSNLSILHDRDSMVASTDLLVNFLYIVSMGLDVVTQSQWASSAASGAASRMHHEKVMHEQIAFWFSPLLVTEQEDVVRAFRKIANSEGSNFSIVSVSRHAKVNFHILKDVVEWAMAARTIRNILGPRAVVAASGVPLSA